MGEVPLIAPPGDGGTAEYADCGYVEKGVLRVVDEMGVWDSPPIPRPLLRAWPRLVVRRFGRRGGIIAISASAGERAYVFGRDILG